VDGQSREQIWKCGWNAAIDAAISRIPGGNSCDPQQIADDIREKIFDPFFTTKTVGRGAGLGLSMARDVVKKHGGTLDVESVEGQGSTFRVDLTLTHP
jgi:light-regulated signal transduction histidine kinase (bacteriophytochrome)